MSKSDVQQLAATVEEIQNRTNEVTQQAIAARTRLEILQSDIPEAVAMGDGVLTQELRVERASLEATVRDSEGSEKILAQKLEFATQQLAKAELPAAAHQAKNARDRLEETVQRIRADVQAYLDTSRDFIQTRNHARRNNEDDRLNVSVKPLSNITTTVVGSLRDLFGLQ